MDEALRCGAILLGKYRIDRVLGQGGMGVVLQVTHLQLDEQLAIKILLPDNLASADQHARFLQEAQSVARLRGEHVVRVRDVGVLPDGAPYMLMEYLHGSDLAGELARRSSLPPGEAVDYALQVCAALAEAHAHGIVHRDIKPGNLFLTARPDGSPLIKVLDFGISKDPVRAARALTQTQTVMGTPGYMSPEQMKATREADGRSDIWSLGVVLYECLAGHPPFEAESFSGVVIKVATEAPPALRPWIPQALQAVVLRCLEKDREQRWPTVGALAQALAPFANDPLAAAVALERTNLLARRSAPPRPATAPNARPDSAPSARPATAPSEQPTTGPSVRPTTGRPDSAPTAFAITGASGGLTGGSHTDATLRPGAMPGIVPGRARDVIELRAQAPSATTLSASAGVSQASPPRRRRAVIGLVAGALSIAAIAIAGRGGDRTPTIVTATTIPRPPLAAGPGPGAAPQPGTSALPGAAVAAPPPPDDRAPRTVARCSELAAHRAWAALETCAAELDQLGGATAARLHAEATQEAASEHQADVAQRALHDGDLRAAQVALGEINEESVYFPQTRDAFDQAEQHAADEAAQHAQALADAHDCAGLARYVAGLPHATERVTAAAQAIACSDKRAEARPSPCAASDLGDLMSQAATQYSGGSARSALALVTRALDCRHSPNMYKLAGIYACAAFDAASARLYYARTTPALQPAIAQKCQQVGLALGTATPEQPTAACATLNVDDAIARAASLYAAGKPQLSLAQVTTALGCQQTGRMYWLATMYACAANDRISARQYFRKVPLDLQAGIEHRCQVDHVNLRGS